MDWRTNDILTVLGNANIVAADFANSGTISVTNSFDITAASDFDNSGTINVTNIFDITAQLILLTQELLVLIALMQ